MNQTENVSVSVKNHQNNIYVKTFTWDLIICACECEQLENYAKQEINKLAITFEDEPTKRNSNSFQNICFLLLILLVVINIAHK